MYTKKLLITNLLAIFMLSFVSCTFPVTTEVNNTLSKPTISETNKNQVIIDVGHGKKGATFVADLSYNIEKNSDFTIKAKNTDGYFEKYMKDIQSYEITLIKGSSSTGYLPTNSDPIGDKLDGPFVINTSTGYLGSIKFTNVNQSSSPATFYYYVGIRAFSLPNAQGKELIKPNNGNVSNPWTGISVANPQIAVSSGKGIQVNNDTNFTITNNTAKSLPVLLNLLDVEGATINTQLNYTSGTISTNLVNQDLTNKVYNIAGNGVAGYFSDIPAIPSITARLNSPSGLCFDSTGGLIIADLSNHLIRRVDLVSGTITSIAGNNTLGNTGDSTLATTAQLNSPKAVAADNSGNIYIADSSNNRIRMINNTGYINNFAGDAGGATGGPPFGNGQSATANGTLSNPSGVFFDNTTSSLYISDTGHNQIRVVSAGNINLVAGSTSGTAGSVDGAVATATFNTPVGIAVNNITGHPFNGAIYVADLGNNKIRVIFGGNVYTLAGTGTGGYSGDGGASVLAQVNKVGGVALDEFGNVYFSDINGTTPRIRKITILSDPTDSTASITRGVITTIVGGGASTTEGTLGSSFSLTNPATAIPSIAIPSFFTIPSDIRSIFISDGGAHLIRRATF